MCAAMTAVIAEACFQTDITVIGRTGRAIDRGGEHLGGIVRDANLIHVRGPGEVSEQDEEYECFSDNPVHGGEFIQIILVTQAVILAPLEQSPQ